MQWISSFTRWATSAATTPKVTPRYAIDHPTYRDARFTPEMLDCRVGR